MRIFEISVAVSCLLAAATSAAAQEKAQPTALLRVLLFADAPTREFPFVKHLLLRDPSKAHLRICLQAAADGTDLLGVEPRQMLKDFPVLTTPAGTTRDYD